jgi:hypothetical protein
MTTFVGIRTDSLSNYDQLWSILKLWFDHNIIGTAKLSSVLKVLTLIVDAPTEPTGNFLREHNAIVDEGRSLHAQLPAYLEQRHAMLISNFSVAYGFAKSRRRIRRAYAPGRLGEPTAVASRRSCMTAKYFSRKHAIAAATNELKVCANRCGQLK